MKCRSKEQAELLKKPDSYSKMKTETTEILMDISWNQILEFHSFFSGGGI
jgi:hypothetical protein